MVQDARAAPRRGADSADGIFPTEIHRPRWPGKNSNEMFRDANRPHARAAAAVRDAEGLVQIQVANVRADVAGRRQRPTCAFMFAPSIYTCPPCLMNERADFPDSSSSKTPCVLGYVTMRHARFVLDARSSLHAQVGHVNVARPCRTRRRRLSCRPSRHWPGLVPCALVGMRQMSRCRFVARRVIGMDAPGGRRIRPASRRWVGVKCRRSQCISASQCSSCVEKNAGSRCACRSRRERMQLRKLGPAHREHFRRSRFSFIVQEPSGIIAVAEREVFCFEAAKVAEHLGLGCGDG